MSAAPLWSLVWPSLSGITIGRPRPSQTAWSLKPPGDHSPVADPGSAGRTGRSGASARAAAGPCRASDTSDASRIKSHRAVFAPFVIKAGPLRGRPPLDRRRVLDAIFRITRTGAPWRDLPEELGNWNSVNRQFRRWTAAGLWDLKLQGLTEGGGDDALQMIDSTIVRAHHCAAGARGSTYTSIRTRLLAVLAVPRYPRRRIGSCSIPSGGPSMPCVPESSSSSTGSKTVGARHPGMTTPPAAFSASSCGPESANDSGLSTRPRMAARGRRRRPLIGCRTKVTESCIALGAYMNALIFCSKPNIATYNVFLEFVPASTLRNNDFAVPR